MKKVKLPGSLWCILIGLTLNVPIEVNAQRIPGITGDVIFITSITPAQFTDGVETEVEVEITYDLVSEKRGVLVFGFNELGPDRLMPKARIPIQQGPGSQIIHIKVVPRYWSDTIGFKASAYIECTANEGAERWYAAADYRRLPLHRGEVSQVSNRNNSRPDETFEDGIMIVSVSPDHFVDGKSQEVVVRVKYELLSRDKGEINVGSSDGRSNGYTIVGSARVDIGQGETEIRATIVPRKTGDLPYAKIFVNLSEFPHRPHWSPVADDSVVVAVE